MKKLIYSVALVALVLVSCQKQEEKTKSGLLRSNFQMEVDGKMTDLYVLTNANGLEMCVTNYGAKVVSLIVPDKDGNFADIVLGEDSIDIYVNRPKDFYYGAVIGRYGNRIGGAKFTLDSVEYVLSANNNGNSLHGGPKGFHHRVWDVEQPDKQTLIFSYVSADMEEGYPGNLTVKMTYKLTDNNEFYVEYEATTDKATVINLTHHSYFNLAGDAAGSINDHILMLNADFYTPVDQTLIPTGEILFVEGTPMDFRTAVAIGDRVNDTAFVQIKYGLGYDHNWVLNKTLPGSLELAATVKDPKSGRVMEVLTTEPAIQFYGGNFMTGNTGKGGRVYPHRGAFCLETQHYPDSPNKPQFPTTVLRPGETYSHVCIYKFSAE
jgi:aldose 1-epimerase